MWARTYNLRTGRSLRPGFTIVELLIVVVVIAILAAITIVAYNGIQQRAITASLVANLESVSKLIKIDHVTNSVYPETLDAVNNNKGIPSSTGVNYQYAVSNTTPQAFCLSATKNEQSYNISGNGPMLAGPCPTAHFEPGNSASYPGTGTVLNDISGNNKHGTLVNGTTYSANNGGALVFDGVNDYVQTPVYIPAGRALSVDVVGSVTSTSVSNNFVNANGPLFIRIIAGKVRWNLQVKRDGETSSTWYFTNGNIPIAANTTYHLAMTYDGASIKGYVNGVKDIDIAVAGQIMAASPVKLGYTTGGEDAPLAGSINVMRVYDKTLSEQDVVQNYTALRGRYGL